MVEANSGDVFGDAAGYDGYVGRWSRLVARQFVPWLAVGPGRTWLDVGAGTGILTQVIVQEASPAKVVGVDSSAVYVAQARRRLDDERVEWRVGDAAEMAFAPPGFDAAVSGLVLNFLPAPQQTLSAIAGAVKGGGLVAAYVWDYTGGMEMMRRFWDAAAELDPVARQMEARQQYELCRPDNLQAMFQRVGLRAIEVRAIDIETRFKDFDDYWRPFDKAQGSIAKYFHSLDDERRSALREELGRRLPVMEDGSIPLTARAWAVKGIASGAAP